jgi:hypothetical protein
MTCIGEDARGGDWCGAPPLVSIELTPTAFWLDPAAVMEVLLAGCNTSTSGMSPNVKCSEPSVIVERICVGEWFRVEVWGRSLWRR